MDVHPPHAGIHSWKDFWIHLGTITVGLLIAIGLEQSVEGLHHIHQRHVLEQELREEAHKNEILIQLDNNFMKAMRPWLAGLRQQVQAARTDGGKTTVVFQASPDMQGIWWCDSPFWNTAKESAQVGLLPSDEGAMFNLEYVEQDEMTLNVHQFMEAFGHQLSFEGRFADAGKPGAQPDFSHMSADDLREYDAVLSESALRLGAMRSATASAELVTKAVLNGAQSDEDLFQAMGGRPESSAKK
jgi:hypothetical protein